MTNPIVDDLIDQGRDAPGISRFILGGPFGVEPLEESLRRLDHFAEIGGRYVETARSYKGGAAEEAIGQWLGANPGVLRVISKVGHDPVTKQDVPLTRAAVESNVRDSLAALRVDRLDVLLYHADEPSRSVNELAETLHEVTEQGLAVEVGASNWQSPRFAELASQLRWLGHAPIASNQFSLAVPDPAALKATNFDAGPEMLALLEAERIPLFAWSAQAGGYFARTEPADETSRARPFETADNAARRDRARQLAAEIGSRPETVALAWTLRRPGTWVAIGPRTVEQIDSSVEALDVDLTVEQLAWLATGQPA